jgi:hypothetical protein
MEKMKPLVLMILLTSMLGSVEAISITNAMQPNPAILNLKKAPVNSTQTQNEGKQVNKPVLPSSQTLLKKEGKLSNTPLATSPAKPTNEKIAEKEVVKASPLKIVAQPIAALKTATVTTTKPSPTKAKAEKASKGLRKEEAKPQLVEAKQAKEEGGAHKIKARGGD